MSEASTARRVEHFDFNLGDQVLLLEVKRPGRVESLTIDFLGVQYRVAYWDDGERKTVWVTKDEIQLR